MTDDEQTGAAADATEKPPQTPKKQQGKRRSPGAKPDAETPPKHEGGDGEESEETVAAETSADLESGASRPELNPPETDKQPSAATAPKGEEKSEIERREVTTTKEESKPRGLGEILRFGRKSVRRPR
jgi:hypothetical protein